MNQKFQSKQKLFFVLTLFALLFVGILKAQAQNDSGISIEWTSGVGCEIYSENRLKNIFIEEIREDDYINVCKGSSVKFTLTGLPSGSTTEWTVSGGVKMTQTNQYVNVAWTGIGMSALSFTITTQDGIIFKTLPINIIQGPTANFISPPTPQQKVIRSCLGVPIYFQDNSSTNGGTSIVSYQWDFGDGNIGVGQNVSHIYEEPGTYLVKLTIRNECNCYDYIKREVVIEKQGIEIICPSIVCENQVETYTIPQEAIDACNAYNWSVIGGTIVGSNQGPSVDVRWDHVDSAGFGYITFTPANCDFPCVHPSTAMIPVIKSQGTITGPTSLCLGKQGKYKIPAWPTTNISWQIVGNNTASIIQTDQRNEIVFTPSNAGTFELVAIYNNTLVHCGGIASITITVNSPQPFTGESSVCLGTTAVYNTVSTAPVNWTLKNSSGNVINTASASNTYSYTFSSIGNYTLTVSGNGICEGQIKNISVTAPLAAPILDAPITQVCTNVPYTYKVLNAITGQKYEWIVEGNGSIIGDDTGNEVNIIFQGNSTVKVRRVQLVPSNCSSAYTSVNITPYPINVDISNTTSVVSQITACSNNYFNYNAINLTGGIYTDAESTFEWSIDPSTAGSIATGQGTPNVSVLWNNVSGQQTYNLVLVIKKCTITKKITKPVIINPVPIISISHNPTICGGNNLLFTVNSSIPLNANTVIHWNFGNNQTQTTAPGVTSVQKYFENGTGANIGYTVTVTIQNANNCSGDLTASSNYIIQPGPNATASLSSSANAFCNVSDINAVLTASVTTGSSIVWYRGTTQVGTGPTLYVNYAAGFTFGSYYFVATKNGCKTTSNSIIIKQDCGMISNCTIVPSPVLTLNATTSCGNIALTGTYNGSPAYTRFSIFGPDVNINNVAGNSGNNTFLLTNINAGQYDAFYTVTYNVNGQRCPVSKNLKINIPYVADFKINAVCNTVNNTDNYLVTLTNHSNFLSTVQNPQFMYERVTSTGALISVISNWSSNQNVNNISLPAGTHYFRQSIRGVLNGVMQTVCTKIHSINLTSMDGFGIYFDQPLCYDKAVEFSVSNLNAFSEYNFLWTFETVDNEVVTNTNPEPSRVFDESYAGGPVTVTLLLTNKYGCHREYTTTVNIPNKCFSGTLVSTPSNAIVCKGNAVQLAYSPGSLPYECAPTGYVWMKNGIVIPGATSSTYLAQEMGYYTVKVDNGNCYYTSPNGIVPTFTPLPTLTFFGSTTICQGDVAHFSINTNATNISWSLDGFVDTNFNGQTFFEIPDLGTGLYEVSVKVIANGCENQQTFTLEVLDAPANVYPTPIVMLDCQNYEVQLTAYAPGDGFYTWSNGQTGVTNPDGSNTIIVNEGGVYGVTFSNALGCSTSTHFTVPKNPKGYAWVVPTGCYDKCKDEVLSLLGPTVKLPSWAWFLNQNPLLSGTNSHPDSLALSQTGTYNFQLNTGLCDYQTESMYLSANECKDCELSIRVKELTLSQSPFCASTLYLEITNPYTNPFQASLISNTNDLIVTPGSITILPGTDLYTFILLPINGFSGGTLDMSITGAIITPENVIECATLFKLDLPLCDQNQSNSYSDPTDKSRNLLDTANITLYPNPATNQVNIRFETEQNNGQIEVYDLTGRLITSYQANTTQGVWKLDLAPVATGIYVVILRQGNTILMQRKLHVVH